MAWQTLDQQYGQQSDKNDRSNYLKDIIAGLSIANNSDPMTLLGYALGRWGSDYVNRGLERRQQEKNKKAYEEAMGGGAPQQQEQQPQQTAGLLDGVKENTDVLRGTPFVSDAAKQIVSEMYPDMRGQAARYLMPEIDWQNRGGGGQAFFDKAASENKPQQAAQENIPAEAQQAQGKNPVPEIVNQIAGRSAARTPQQDFNMTSEEVYQRAFDIARANGSTMGQARQFAQQQAGLYQSQRVQALSDQFLNGGVNPDGTINNQGVATLARLAQENPNQTNMLGNMYLNPQAQAKNAQDIAKMMMNSDLHLRNTLQAQQQAADLREQAAQAAFGRQWDMLNARQQMEIDQKMRLAEILSSAGGLSPQEAIISAFGGGRGGSGGGSRGGGSSNDAKADKEHFTRLDKWLERYDKAYRDPISGEWADGKGPGDPEYDDRLDQYNRYTAKQYDADNYEDAIRITQSLIDKGYPAEGVAQYVDEHFGELAPNIKRSLNLK